mgnify:CR=1 FL=1
MANHFDQVAEFMNVSEQPVRTAPSTIDEKTLDFRLSLVMEETQELAEAVENDDYVEMVDALADIIYVVDGFAHTLGVDLNKAFRLVHESNMTKFCVSEEEAKETVEWYKKNESRYDSPAYRLSKGGRWIVYNKSTSKVLKSINYKPVDLTQFRPT